MIKKIVLTGGPCSGKSTSITKIKRKFEEQGFIVLVVSETATELINSGIKCFGQNKLEVYDFQKFILMQQLSKENLIDMYINQNEGKDIIILYDRSILDNKSYLTEDEYKSLLKEFNLSESSIIQRYDMAIHLVTAAQGTDFYTLENNSARSETKEEAIRLDRKTLNSYLGFPHHVVIDNSTDFDEKIDRVIDEISNTVRGKVTNVKQRKYLVSDVDNDFLKNNARKILITQTYLNKSDKDVMVRKINYGDSSSYYVSIKYEGVKQGESIVTERIISEKQYYDLVADRTDFLKKERYCFESENQIYRLDKFSNGLMILEIEGFAENINLPYFIKVEKDITDNKNYSNKSIANELSKKKHLIYN